MERRCGHVFQGDRCIDRFGHSGKHTNKFGPEGIFWDDFHSQEVLYTLEPNFTYSNVSALLTAAEWMMHELGDPSDWPEFDKYAAAIKSFRESIDH